jgi:hypothetical protein
MLFRDRQVLVELTLLAFPVLLKRIPAMVDDVGVDGVHADIDFLVDVHQLLQ